MAAKNTTTPEIDLDQIIAALDIGWCRAEFPEEALRQAQRHREQIIPRLIDALRSATAKARDGKAREAGLLPLFALVLLTEFEAKEALPAILETVSLPEGPLNDLFDDYPDRLLDRLLATLASDRRDLIDGLIHNRDVSVYTRWSAAKSYGCLMLQGKLSRDEAVDILRRHLREAIANRDKDVVTPLIDVLESLGPRRAREELIEAYRLKLADESLIPWEWVEDTIIKGEEEVRKSQASNFGRPPWIEDTIKELRMWPGFEVT